MGGPAGGRAARAVGAREAPGEASGDPARAIALASILALLVGGIMVLAGAAKLGFIADLISKPTIVGYLNGLALTILVAQLPKLFGFSVEGDGFIPDLKGFVRGL